MINRKFLFLLMVPLFILALATSSCDSGGDDGGGSSVQRDVTIEGSLSDVVVAKADTGAKAKFFAFIDNILKITKIARAQQTILEGITVEAFDPATDPDMVNPLATDTTDANGEFTLEGVPCDTPLKLVFTFEDLTVTIGDGVVAPCPDGDDTGVIIMTFSINFGNGNGSVDDMDVQTDPSGSQVSCIGGDQQQMIDDEFFVDGDGGACIIAAGNCELEIVASSVKLINCSSCVEARGSANVEIQTTDFECEASEDGIRTVGSSTVDIDVIAGDMIDDMMDGEPMPTDMMDGEPMPTDMQALIQLVKDQSIVGSGNGNILIIAEEDGVDLRGNTEVELEAFPSEDENGENGEDGNDDDNGEDGNDDDDDDATAGDDDDDATAGDDDDDSTGNPIFTRDGETANITIDGGDNGIIAVGNSEAEVRALSCDISPGTTSNGNADIQVNCGPDEFDEE